MHRSYAAAGSAVFFVLAPGTVAGLMPWLITRWESAAPVGLRIAGAVVVVAGLVPLLAAFRAFVRAGGTPAPPAPTQELVVSGFNRYVRNPMYVGVVSVIAGQALLFGSLALVLYAVVAWAVMATFVRWYEEPALARQYGLQYEAYQRAVPAWLPRRPTS